MARSLKYLDACIIIAAAKGTEELFDAALALIADPECDFIASRAVTLEAVAPPAAHGFTDQAEFAREFHINYPLLLGGVEALELLRQVGNRSGVLPYTLVIDRKGNLVSREPGGLKEARLESLIQLLL